MRLALRNLLYCEGASFLGIPPVHKPTLTISIWFSALVACLVIGCTNNQPALIKAAPVIVVDVSATPPLTQTSTLTSTPIPTPTDTPEPTNTSIPTATRTPLPTETLTPTSTPTPEPTHTSTAIVSPTSTTTDMPIPTATRTPTTTATRTITPTGTPTMTPTATSTHTPRPTSTPSPTRTPTPAPYTTKSEDCSSQITIPAEFVKQYSFGECRPSWKDPNNADKVIVQVGTTFRLTSRGLEKHVELWVKKHPREKESVSSPQLIYKPISKGWQHRQTYFETWATSPGSSSMRAIYSYCPAVYIHRFFNTIPSSNSFIFVRVSVCKDLWENDSYRNRLVSIQDSFHAIAYVGED